MTITILEQFGVFTSAEPHADIADWIYQPAILPIGFSRKLFPEISFAKFIYHVGEFPVHFTGLATGVYSPVPLMRMFIRLAIAKQFQLGGSWEVVDDWIGIISRTDLENIMAGRDVVSGDLSFTAFGVESELEYRTVSKTTIKGTGGNFDIGRGIGFNETYRNVKPGNMSTGPEEAPPFSGSVNREIKDTAGNEVSKLWTVKKALQYTVYRDAIKLNDEMEPEPNEIQWGTRFQTPTLLDGFPNPKVSREGRSVIEIMSELVPKKSGVVCRVGFDTQGLDQTKLRFIFDYISTAVEPITVGEFTFPKSPEQFSLDIRDEAIVEQFAMSESAYDSWDQVQVESAFIRVSFSVNMYDDSIWNSWSPVQEEEYKNPDVSDVESPEEKNKAADDARNSPELQEVFRTWVMAGDAFKNPLGGAVDFCLSPLPENITLEAIPEGGTAGILTAFTNSGTKRFDITRKEFLPEHPFEHRPIIGETKSPEVYFLRERFPEDLELDIDYDLSKWVRGDKIGIKGSSHEGRQWNVGVSVGHSESRTAELHQGPSIHLDVQGSMSHVIAPDEMKDVEHISPENDPATDLVAGLSWHDAFVSLAIETDLRYTVKIPAELSLTTGAPARVKRVVLEECRLDFVLPGFIRKVDSRGFLVVSEDGKIANDDRKLLDSAAALMWEMNKIARRPFTASVREVYSRGINVGSVIRDVVSSAGRDDSNTVVSQIEYDFKSFTTSYVTQFEESEIVQTLISKNQDA